MQGFQHYQHTGAGRNGQGNTAALSGSLNCIRDGIILGIVVEAQSDGLVIGSGVIDHVVGFIALIVEAANHSIATGNIVQHRGIGAIAVQNAGESMIATQNGSCGVNIILCIAGNNNTGALCIHQHMVDGSDLVVGFLHHGIIAVCIAIGANDAVTVIIVAGFAGIIITEILRLEKREILDTLCAEGQRCIDYPQRICLGVITGSGTIRLVVTVIGASLGKGPEGLILLNGNLTDGIQRFQIGQESVDLQQGILVILEIQIGIKGQHIHICADLACIVIELAVIHTLAAMHIDVAGDIGIRLQSLCQLAVVVVALVEGICVFAVGAPVVSTLRLVHDIDAQEGIVIAVSIHIGSQILRGSDHSMVGYITVFILFDHIQACIGNKHADAVLFSQGKGLLYAVPIVICICRGVCDQVDAAILDQLEDAVSDGCIAVRTVETANGHHILAAQEVIAQAVGVILG